MSNWYYEVRMLLGWVRGMDGKLKRGWRRDAVESLREVTAVYYERGYAAAKAECRSCAAMHHFHVLTGRETP